MTMRQGRTVPYRQKPRSRPRSRRQQSRRRRAILQGLRNPIKASRTKRRPAWTLRAVLGLRVTARRVSNMQSKGFSTRTTREKRGRCL